MVVKKEKNIVSKCCESSVHVIPSVFRSGSQTQIICSKCLMECETKIVSKDTKNN